MELGFKGLKVYQLAYQLSMEIYVLSKQFPREETYALTDQIRRSSRSICTNIGEGYRKKKYPKHFSSKMTDADGECTETLIWLDFGRDCGYISSEKHESLYKQYIDVGRMLGTMAEFPERFTPKNRSNT